MRLTTFMRKSLATEVLSHRFADEVEKLIADKTKFGCEVYDDIYRKPEREKMASLPEGWLRSATSISAQFGEHSSNYENVFFKGSTHGILNRIRKLTNTNKSATLPAQRVLEKHRNGCAKKYPDDHRLSVRYQALKADARDLQVRVEGAEKQIEAALFSINTLPALLKAWPEIEPFTKRYFSVPSKLPALPVGALNEMFKLPISKTAQAAAACPIGADANSSPI